LVEALDEGRQERLGSTDPREAYAKLPEIVGGLLQDVAFPPTNVHVAAKIMCVDELNERRRLPFSGSLERAKAGYRVVYAAEQPPARKRFTIAHELGHAYLLARNLASGWTEREVEAFCDRFAAELLMPVQALEPMLRAEVTVAALGEISERFEVSLQVAASRISQLTSCIFFVVNSRELLWASSDPGSYDSFRPCIAERALAQRKSQRDRVWDSRGRCWWSVEAMPRRNSVIMMLRREDAE
jgi:hypothetical protein